VIACARHHGRLAEARDEVPPVNRVLDMGPSRQAPRIQRITDRMVANRGG
jgi:hypothetical protein